MKSQIVVIPMIVALLSGCSSNDNAPGEFIDSLADTLWAGAEREVVLTTGSGAWYYDDALGSPRRHNYGFYILETKAMAGWDLLDDSGRSLRDNAEYSIVHPEFVLRRYASGLTERVECLPGLDALALTFSIPRPQSSVFRLYGPATVTVDTGSSNRPLDSTLTPIDVSFSVESSRIISMSERKVEHPQSLLRGEPAYSIFSSDREYRLPSKQEWSCLILIAGDSSRPVKSPSMVLESLPDQRRERRRRSEAALANLPFQCEMKSIERAFALARIKLESLYFERGRDHGILAGFPRSPSIDPFHTSLASIGFNRVDSSRSRAIKMFETILDYQNNQDDPEYPCRLPSSIKQAGVDYSTSTTAGALALSFDRIVAQSFEVPIGLPTRFLRALDLAVGAELNSDRHVLGLIAGPGLFDNVGFPPRERRGALLETQSLFSIARIYLASHREGSPVELEVPESALRGSWDWKYPYLPGIAVGLADKQFKIPLSIESTLTRYRNSSWVWSDRLIIPETSDEDLITPQLFFNTPYDSAQSVVQLLSIFWLEKKDKRITDRLLTQAEDNLMIGRRGFRSLSPKDPEFQSSHVFTYGDAPVNARLSGDALVWTCGVLADLYTSAGRHKECSSLFESLSVGIVEEGVVGGLPESENGYPTDGGDNVGRNPLFASSLAEYVRMLPDNILGIDTKRQSYPAVKLAVPRDWGNIEFSFQAAGSIITIKRVSPDLWTAQQDGSPNPVSLEVALWPEPGVRGYGSIKLNPKYLIKFKVIPTDVGRFTLGWNEFERDE